jgi:PAS domain S-box-containing protein
MIEGMAGNEGSEPEALRRRIAALEAELAELRKGTGAVDGPLPVREALLSEAERMMHTGTWFLNLESGEVKWSDEFFRILGYDPGRDAATTENFFQAIHPEDRARCRDGFEALRETGKPAPFAGRVVWKDGTIREVSGDARVVPDAEGRILRVVGSMMDVTERKLLEAQLRQSHKMEAVGRLAAGVAHDFNNLLSVISGNADLLLDGSQDDRARRIRDAAEVGAALTRQLLAFSRQSVIRPELLDLGEVVRDTTRIIERLIGENIAVRLSLCPDRCSVLADRAQIQQILLNLCINARDAMPGGGTIGILAEAAPDEPAVPAASGLPANGTGAAQGGPAWVRLVVEDSGSGMDEATRARAFEPFFTTKEPGKGTGLGLYAVKDAVTQAGGRISIDSLPGRGTRVAILLPRRANAPAQAAQASRQAPGGRETVLVVEDHPALRELIRCFLADVGYKVHAVGRPGEAVALWDREGGGIELLITDLVMPEKSGRALAAELGKRKPGLSTLFISGYAQGMGPGTGVEGPYLQKPFTRMQLLETVRGILDGHPAPDQDRQDKASWSAAGKVPADGEAQRIVSAAASGKPATPDS